jgi:hypothetical protein
LDGPTYRALKYRIACSRHRIAFLNFLERLGGNENGFGCALTDLAPGGIMKTSSYIWMFALLMLGNVSPSEPIGRIVQLNFSRNLGHSFASLTSECGIDDPSCGRRFRIFGFYHAF